jgi:hypothetical protein
MGFGTKIVKVDRRGGSSRIWNGEAARWLQIRTCK